VDNGSHVDKAKTPPSVCGEVNAIGKNMDYETRRENIEYLHV
jgi:hypothetical protein